MKSVQELVLPELTDDWVAENIGDESVQAWRATVRTVLENRRLDSARRLFVDRTTSALADLVEDEPPKPLVDSEIRHRAEHFANDLARQGIPFERYLEATGLTQANVSRHVQSLVDAGMVGRRREGLTAICFIADPSINHLCDTVCTNLMKRLAQKVKNLAGS